MDANLQLKATAAKMAAARSFVRSLNILLKFVRLYGFDHTRAAEQFEIAWTELAAAIPPGDETGLLLGAAGTQLVLNGEPVESANAERSFAQLLSVAGLASIQFLPRVQRDDLSRFVRAFPVGNAKASALAEQLKSALTGSQGIRINEIRFVAEDASTAPGEGRLAATLAAKTLGADAGLLNNALSDPQKLLQLIAAAEGSRGGPGSSGKGVGSGGEGSGDAQGASGTGSGGSETGTSTGSGSGTESGPGSGLGSGTGTGAGSGGPGSGPGMGPGNGSGAGNGNGGPNTPGTGSGAGGSGSLAEKIIAGFGAASKTGVSGPSGSVSNTIPASNVAGTSINTGINTGIAPAAGSGTSVQPNAATTGAAPAYSGGSQVGNVTFGNGSGGNGPGGSGGSGNGAGNGPGNGSNAAFGVRDEEIFNVLRLLSHLGQSAEGGRDGLAFGAGSGPFQAELSKLSGGSRDVLQKALASLAAQAPSLESNDPMLLRLAEHLAIRFALDRYERGEIRVNAVRQMLDRMSQEIGALRQILGTHEEKMSKAGMAVESHADLLDRQFWASVPEASKRAVLTSPEAWCIPPRNVRHYIEELRRKDDHDTAGKILANYAAAISNDDANARRRTAIGLSELADLYAAGDGRSLGPAIRAAGLQLGIERESELQGLISAAFVRLTQEAGAQNRYRAVLQSLDSLESIEGQRPAFAQSVRPRMGMDKRLPDYMEEAIRMNPRPDGLMELLERMPRPSAEYLVARFNRNGYRPECERIVDVAQLVGAEAVRHLRETLMTGQPHEAAEVAGLLSRLDSLAVEKWLHQRMQEWPRMPQDRALRLIAAGGAAERGWLLLSIFDQLDPVLQPLAVDEIGMAGDASAIDKLTRMASGDLPSGAGPYLRLKAVEALGRLHAAQSAELLRTIVEAKKLWRWMYPAELRIAAFQALREIDPQWSERARSQSGLDADDLELAPKGPSAQSPWFRQRRYPRLRLKAPVPATASTERETVSLELRGLSLSGGLAAGEKHSTPGTLVSMKIGTGLRPIRVQAFMRDARAQGLGFEFADMDLEERGRLRRFLHENAAPLGGNTRQQDAPQELAEVAPQ